MIKLRPSSHKIETAFVIALFTMFAATAVLVVLIGARQYQNTANSMNLNYEIRTLSSYLEEKIRQHDAQDSIAVTDLSGVPSICITTYENNTSYMTYIYQYDGAIRELFVSSNAVFSIDAGQTIMDAHSFIPEIMSSDLIKVTYEDTNDVTHELYLPIHSTGGVGGGL